MIWSPGDIAVETGPSKVDRLIQFGQRIHGCKLWQWNHAIVVINAAGDTIEAGGHGIVRGTIGSRDVAKLRFPAGVDRERVVMFAATQLGVKYNYPGVVLLGVDCLFDTKLHSHGKTMFCSELAAAALNAGGWHSPLIPARTMPADLADELGVDNSATMAMIQGAK